MAARDHDDTGNLLPGERVAGEVIAEALLGHFVDGVYVPDAAVPFPSRAYPLLPEPNSGLVGHLAAPSEIEATAKILGERNQARFGLSRAAPAPRPGSFHTRSLRRFT